MCSSHVTLRGMCGIAALFAKTPRVASRCGAYLAAMLEALADRGPDSTGVAIFRDPAPPGLCKVTVLAGDGSRVSWESLGADAILADRGDQAVLLVPEADPVRWVAERAPGLIVLGYGRAIELAKRRGRAEGLISQIGLREVAATHALGHTRMATESAVVTAGSHPFSTGDDLCLVHNGSLSNHNRLRAKLRRDGVTFQTENDSEVAAGYLQWRLGKGDHLSAALERALHDLDGFFTFAVGTRDGFAVVRDRIACKPAILAESDEWVAMGSEFRALAELPGMDDARIWEAEPGTVYAWAHAAVNA